MDGLLLLPSQPEFPDALLFRVRSLEELSHFEIGLPIRPADWPLYRPLCQESPGTNELQEEEQEALQETSPEQPLAVRQKRVRILLADDHETVRTGVRIILGARKEYDIIEAANGADALAEVERKRPDLIILDLTMPGLDGFTVAQEVRKHSPSIPILFFSMHQLSPALLSLAKSRQVQGFVCKSESGLVLLRAVETLLAKKEFFPSET